MCIRDRPSCLKFLDPHPYFHLGAPYKDKTSIWKLREEVVNRLVKVNDYLISKSSFNILIYDSWRPLEVQEFMFKRAFLLECEKSDINISFENIKNKEASNWNSRRHLLREIMTKFGCAQHPNEWWHFSYGDQLWAWKLSLIHI